MLDIYMCTYGGGGAHEVFCVLSSLLTLTLTSVFLLILIPVLLVITALIHK